MLGSCCLRPCSSGFLNCFVSKVCWDPLSLLRLLLHQSCIATIDVGPVGVETLNYCNWSLTHALFSRLFSSSLGRTLSSACSFCSCRLVQASCLRSMSPLLTRTLKHTVAVGRQRCSWAARVWLQPQQVPLHRLSSLWMYCGCWCRSAGACGPQLCCPGQVGSRIPGCLRTPLSLLRSLMEVIGSNKCWLAKQAWNFSCM